MSYEKEVIFHSMEEAIEFYKGLGFVFTTDKRLVLNKKVEVEIRLHRLGPQMLRSSVIIIETDI
jgi:hypothetical protein